MSNDRLNARADLAEMACVTRDMQHETRALIEMLRPLIDGLYDTGSYPGVTHNYLELRRKEVVLGQMLEMFLGGGQAR